MHAAQPPTIAAVSTGGASERRGVSRYEITAPVVWDHGDGLTENLSTAGVYFSTGKRLEPGQPLRLTVTLPLQAAVIVGEGVVLRVELRDEGYGVAARFDSLMPGGDGDP